MLKLQVYLLLGNASENQKTILLNWLKQIEGIFLGNQLNDLIIDNLKENIQLQNNIKYNIQ